MTLSFIEGIVPMDAFSPFSVSCQAQAFPVACSSMSKSIPSLNSLPLDLLHPAGYLQILKRGQRTQSKVRSKSSRDLLFSPDTVQGRPMISRIRSSSQTEFQGRLISSGSHSFSGDAYHGCAIQKSTLPRAGFSTDEGSSSQKFVAKSVEAEVAIPVSSEEDLKAHGDDYFVNDLRPIILFDGVCNMCNGGVNFMLDNDKEGKMRFAALQSEAGSALLLRSGRAADDISSIVLVDKDRAYIKSEAILRIGRCLGFPFSQIAFLGLGLPSFVRDIFYDNVADNRYSIYGRTDSCRMSDPRFAERFVL